MREGHASSTSSMVTFMRALAHGGLTDVRDFNDPTAMPMLTPAWRLPGQAIVWWMQHRPQRRAQMLKGAEGRMDLVALRTKVLDAAWEAAHAAGTRQLVLLGAGLDGRAYRLPTLADSTVFEVDHPSTQALKRHRVAQLQSVAKQHVFIPVDFKRDRLADALAHYGQLRDVPTAWIWEGVTTYLERPAQQATLAAMAARSCPGSTLAMTYVEPPKQPSRAMRRTAMLVRALGEPFVGFVTREQAAELLHTAGFRVREDSGMNTWRERYAHRAGREDDVPERIAVAERV